MRPFPLSIIIKLVVVTLFSITTARAENTGDAYFQEGLSAFRAGNYQQAQTQFLSARRAGIQGVTLDYNLGVTYYKLEDYPAAHKEFERVSRHRTMAPLAYYNLGLVTLKLNNVPQARYWFQLAYNDAKDTKLRALADLQLEKLRDYDDGVRKWSLSTRIAAGYDDNLIDPGLLISSTKSDGFAEVFAFASGPIPGSNRTDLRIDISAYAIRYQDLGDYDMNVVRGGLARLGSIQGWRTEAGVDLEQNTLGDDDYLRLATIDLTGRRPVNPNTTLKLRYRYTSYDALNAAYNPLHGQQHRLNIEGDWKYTARRLRLIYELELNERDDLRDSVSFSSYSPTRNGLRAIAGIPFAPGWKLEAESSYRNSRYNDPNILSDGTILARADKRLQIGFRVSRDIGEKWQVFAQYIYTDNDSNIAFYDYDRNLYSSGLSGLF